MLGLQVDEEPDHVEQIDEPGGVLREPPFGADLLELRGDACRPWLAARGPPGDS